MSELTTREPMVKLPIAMYGALEARVKELEAENLKLRQALGKIASLQSPEHTSDYGTVELTLAEVVDLALSDVDGALEGLQSE